MVLLLMEKYSLQAKDLGMANSLLITQADIFFDIRAILKCRWGCEEFSENNIKCHTRNTSYKERVAMIKKYNHILLVHSHDVNELSNALLEIERTAFLDGYYFAFALRRCHLCKICVTEQGKPCPSPSKIRPCEGSFGIDVYKTARNLGLPCQPLKNKEETQNWYGFVLID
jgi:predicted metal-binding protein